jgi:subtilisin-like proprotein convertase family protein
MRRVIFSVMLLPLLASVASADVSGSGGGGSITDFTKSTSTITIGADEVIKNIKVTITGLSHTWVGDLIARLHGPDGNSVDLFHRTGLAGGGKGGCCGDSSDVAGTYMFFDTAPGDWWSAALGTTGPVPPGSYWPTTADGAFDSLKTKFAGGSTAGAWTLSIGDWAGGDTGGWSGWSIEITSNVIPEPTSFGLLAGLAGLAFIRRRR